MHGYVTAMFNDIAYAYTKTRQLERDKTRLLHELTFRGLEVLAVELPSLCKHFDRCLGEELYTLSSLPLSRPGKKGVVIPALMQDLYLQIFTPEGLLRSEPPANVIVAIRQALKGLSKVKIACRKERIDAEVDNFHSIEASLPSPDLDWSADWDDVGDLGHLLSNVCLTGYEPRSGRHEKDDVYGSDGAWNIFHPRHHRPEALVQRVADIISTSLGDFFVEEAFTDGDTFTPKHGKGRVSNLRKGESKFSFLEWPSKLECVFPYDFYATHHLGLRSEVGEKSPGDIKSPSKLIAVPKSLKTPRLIASEPNQNMWIQQLLMKQVYTRVRENPFLSKCIDFSNQKHNASLALSSSRSGSHATIDLSSASDRFSLRFLERIFRKNPTFLMRFHASRTEVIENAINNSWEHLVLKKAFSQGNALTFPIQSIGYAIVCVAAILIDKNQSSTASNIKEAVSGIRVYGDDMIVPVDSFVTTVNLLEMFDFQVNLDKTFSKGKFRESCGVDAYDGVSVTPAYVKNIAQSPNHYSAVSTIEASNNLHKDGWWHLAAWQGSLVSHLKNGIPIMHVRDKVLGFCSYSGRTTSHLRKRYSSELHRPEVQVYKLVSKSKKKDHPLGTQHFLQWTVERPAKDLKWSSGVELSSSAVLRRGWVPDITETSSAC